MEEPRKKFKALTVQSDVPAVEGYVSKVSAAKISKNGTHYFNAVIQVSGEKFHDVVSYKMQLHAHFLKFAETKQAIKLSNIRKACSKY